jgi:hypothetical protein
MEKETISTVIDGYSRSLESTVDVIGTLMTRLRETGDELVRLQESTQSLIDEAVLAEREACAKVCEDLIGTRAMARHCADAIRARGGEK